MSALTIELLYPEIANLHGDHANMDYLAQCRPDATLVRTGLTDAPAFASQKVDLVYLGPLTEDGQRKAIERLRPHRERLEALIEAGTVFLFTHNAVEVLGARIRNAEMDYDVAGVGIFDIESEVHMFGRYSGKVMGVLPALGDAHPVIGYKSQFSMLSDPVSLSGFLTADRGIGRNRGTAVEGVRVGNFIGTSLIGPLLVNNPHFTKHVLSLIDPDSEPSLAHEELAIASYEKRLEHFREPRRWHQHERVKNRR